MDGTGQRYLPPTQQLRLNRAGDKETPRTQPRRGAWEKIKVVCRQAVQQVAEAREDCCAFGQIPGGLDAGCLPLAAA